MTDFTMFYNYDHVTCIIHFDALNIYNKNLIASQGFAFITYVLKESAHKAILGINGYAYGYLILKVEWAK